MEFNDFIRRSEAYAKIHAIMEKYRGNSPNEQLILSGLAKAMDAITGLNAEGKWHDPGDERFPVPADALMLLEITQGQQQNVKEGWYDTERYEWRSVRETYPSEWVTGWQLLPAPRKEKRHA